MKLLPRLAAALAFSLAAFGASAAPTDPTATSEAPGVFSFEEYLGSGPIGNNNLNINNTVFWFYEGSFDYLGKKVDSWFVFFDPRSDRAKGEITFAGSIVELFDTKPELIASAIDGFGKAGVSYDYSRAAVGLEPGDELSYAGKVLSLFWQAGNPGDHIRVLTVVPEPSTYALLALGLLALGVKMRRRQA